jgi:hypothetical protein
MPDAETPRFRVSNEGEPYPSVDPEDLKRVWKIQPGDKQAWIAERARDLNHSAISKRCWMIRVLADKPVQLLAPWQRGTELDDAVFRLAATFPIRPLRQHTYHLAGDSHYGFDPNAFVQKLIEETGIPHVWEPVPATVTGGCGYTFIRVGSGTTTFPPPPDSEREIRQKIRELLWAVWSKCQPNISRPSPNHVEYDVPVIAMQFAEFAIDNNDLAREFISGSGDRLTTVLQLERNATWGDLECTVCQRPMQEHSDEEMAHCRQSVQPGKSPFRWRTS